MVAILAGYLRFPVAGVGAPLSLGVDSALTTATVSAPALNTDGSGLLQRALKLHAGRCEVSRCGFSLRGRADVFDRIKGLRLDVDGTLQCGFIRPLRGGDLRHAHAEGDSPPAIRPST